MPSRPSSAALPPAMRRWAATLTCWAWWRCQNRMKRRLTAYATTTPLRPLRSTGWRSSGMTQKEMEPLVSMLSISH